MRPCCFGIALLEAILFPVVLVVRDLGLDLEVDVTGEGAGVLEEAVAGERRGTERLDLAVRLVVNDLLGRVVAEVFVGEAAGRRLLDDVVVLLRACARVTVRL